MTLRFLQILAVFSVLTAMPALAQDDAGFSKLQPLPAAAMDDAAPIRMTPEGPAVIKLDEDAASVIVGNPAHATAILENPRLIMLMPQQPGATKVMALDRSGKAIFNRHVLVGGGSKGFIRINRACNSSQNADCRPVSMYYCPDRCYQTAVAQPESAITQTKQPPAPPAYAPPQAMAPNPDSAGQPIADDLAE